MKVHCRKLTKAEAVADSRAAIAAQRRLMRKWEKNRTYDAMRKRIDAAMQSQK